MQRPPFKKQKRQQSNSNSPKAIRFAYFYDNSRSVFDSKAMCKWIVGKKVPDNGVTYNKMPDEEQKTQYFKQLDTYFDPDLIFANIMFRYAFYPDIKSGITFKQMERLKKDIISGKNIKKVVFDFDRTLTKVEGFPKDWVSAQTPADLVRSI
jgi:hypothetical protein